MGDIGAYSFHETKNVISGEGGALLVNRPELVKKAEIIREKGTDRSQFFRGEVDKYTWQDLGSSFLPGELIAAFLWAQLENAESITQARLASWGYYHELLQPLESQGLLRRPTIPDSCQHNAHMYYVILEPDVDRAELLKAFRASAISSVFHYIPLHSSPAGKKYGRVHSSMEQTDDLSQRIVRLPLWVGISEEQQDRVIAILKSHL
jgi:dTDP-4-amino-4,6-dideoxygalactose transaminase